MLLDTGGRKAARNWAMGLTVESFLDGRRDKLEQQRIARKARDKLGGVDIGQGQAILVLTAC